MVLTKRRLRRWHAQAFLVIVVGFGFVIGPAVGTHLVHGGAAQSDSAIVAKCKNCTCGGPRKHPNMTKTTVVLQCPVRCGQVMRSTEFCDAITIPTDPDLIRPPRSAQRSPNGPDPRTSAGKARQRSSSDAPTDGKQLPDSV